MEIKEKHTAIDFVSSSFFASKYILLLMIDVLTKDDTRPEQYFSLYEKP